MSLKWLLSFVLSFGMLASNAQFRKIPASVTDAFKTKFASASSVEWKDKITAFEANFTVGEREMKASFTPKGEWLKTETKHTYNSLPLEVKDGFKKSKYAEMPVLEVKQIEDYEKGTQFRIVVKRNEYNKRNLVFSKTGQLQTDTGTF